jgi:hypothetical protein
MKATRSWIIAAIVGLTALVAGGAVAIAASDTPSNGPAAISPSSPTPTPIIGGDDDGTPDKGSGDHGRAVGDDDDGTPDQGSGDHGQIDEDDPGPGENSGPGGGHDDRDDDNSGRGDDHDDDPDDD